MKDTSMGKLEVKARSVQLTAEIESHPCGNCLQMCFRNKENLAYQVGRVS